MGNKVGVQVKPASGVLMSERRYALGVIDVQNDFCRGGALAVEGANDTLAEINKLIFALHQHIPIFHSQDYHPADHMSFAATHDGAKPFETRDLHLKLGTAQAVPALCTDGAAKTLAEGERHPSVAPSSLKMEDGTFVDVKQTLWPKHCVQETYGSQFHGSLIVTKQDKIIQKGTKSNVESYSAFGDDQKGKYERTELEKWLRLKKTTDVVLVGIATDYCVYFTALDAIRLGFRVHLVMSCTRGVAEDTTAKAIEDMTDKGVLMYDDVDTFYRQFKHDMIQ